MKTLILKPSALGDVIQALPVLRLLKRHQPEGRIYWWIASPLAPLLEDDPDLEGLYYFDRQRWSRIRHWPVVWRHLQDLKAGGFDWVIDLQGLARTGWIAWWVKGHLSAGVADPREGAGAFYDLPVSRPSYQTHAVDWYLEVLRVLGVPVRWDFDWLPPRPSVQAALEERWQPEPGPWIALHPGARWPNKRWPAEAFVALVNRLRERHPDLRFVLLGGPEDAERCHRIARSCGACCLNLAGRTSLPEMVEWIRRSRLMVTGDSGPMHVAAAMDKPVVALFGPTHPARTGPYGQVDRVLQSELSCVPCMNRTCHRAVDRECLRLISPEAVASEISRRLALTSSG